VLAYLREQLAARRRRQWVSKLLVVGEGGVGKTSLLRALRGEPHIEGLETTHANLPRHSPVLSHQSLSLCAGLERASRLPAGQALLLAGRHSGPRPAVAGHSGGCSHR